jgi:hypothetical protein
MSSLSKTPLAPQDLNYLLLIPRICNDGIVDRVKRALLLYSTAPVCLIAEMGMCGDIKGILDRRMGTSGAEGIRI